MVLCKKIFGILWQFITSFCAALLIFGVISIIAGAIFWIFGQSFQAGKFQGLLLILPAYTLTVASIFFGCDFDCGVTIWPKLSARLAKLAIVFFIVYLITQGFTLVF